MSTSPDSSTEQLPQKNRQSYRSYGLRLAWLCLLLLSAAKIAIGEPVDYATRRQVCLDSETVCSNNDYLTPEQVQVIESAGISLPTYANLTLVLFTINLLVWGGIGVFIFLLRPNDRLAWLASGMMIVYPSSGLETQIRAVFPSLGFAADLLFNLGNILMFLFIALFPNGRYSPPWLRWYWLGMILFSIPPTVILIPLPAIAAVVIVIFWISFLILGPYSQIYRYRFESTAVERQQTKWVVAGFATFAGLILFLFLAQSLAPPKSLGQLFINLFLFDLAGLLIPLSIAFSILRYRLWDIDLVIRRTLQYSLVTLMLALVYFGGVTLLQSLFTALSGQQSPAALVLSTLLIAALFNPLRKRIQNFIDRRFYRQRYDAEQALAQFASTARHETELNSLTEQLNRIVLQTLHPAQTSLWLVNTKRIN